MQHSSNAQALGHTQCVRSRQKAETVSSEVLLMRYNPEGVACPCQTQTHKPTRRPHPPARLAHLI